jgi:hypothetical protein
VAPKNVAQSRHHPIPNSRTASKTPTLVSGGKLAAHFGVTRQHVDQLAQQGVLERRPDNLFDEDVSRLRYAETDHSH